MARSEGMGAEIAAAVQAGLTFAENQGFLTPGLKPLH
jgi:hypothetical protein